MGVAAEHKERRDGPHPRRGTWAEEPEIDGWVRDEAGGHKGQDMQAIAASPGRAVALHPAPDLVERFFRELHRVIEGRVYPTLPIKQGALEPILNAWQ